MALFRRQKKDVSVLPEEVQDYYRAERRDRTGKAWLLAIATLIVTFLIAAGLFFGGRWIFRTIFGNDDNKGSSQSETQQEASSEESEQSDDTDQSTDNNSTNTDSSSTNNISDQPTSSSNQPSTSPSTTSTPPAQTPSTGPSELVNTGPGDEL